MFPHLFHLFWSGAAQRSRTNRGKPTKNIFSAEKWPSFKDPNFDSCFRFFDVSMIISIDLDAKAYLRYWNFALTSKTSSKWCFDRFPSQFSRIWAPLQQFLTFSRQVQFCCNDAQILENSLGSLSKHWFDDVFEVSAKFQYRSIKNQERSSKIIIET